MIHSKMVKFDKLLRLLRFKIKHGSPLAFGSVKMSNINYCFLQSSQVVINLDFINSAIGLSIILHSDVN